MKQLTATAKKIDTFFKVLSICLKIGIVCCLVYFGIVAVGYLFDLDPYSFGTGYNSLGFGRLSIVIAEDYAPEEWYVLGLLSVNVFLGLIFLLIAQRCCVCVRDILQPMTQGEPFHSTISSNLKKLARNSLILCIIVNCMELATTFMFVRGYNLAELLRNEKITEITFHTDFDLTLLVLAAVLYLLSYIFRYGEELQRLSDETL